MFRGDGAESQKSGLKDSELTKAIEPELLEKGPARLQQLTVIEPDGYRDAVRTEFDAESNWRHAFSKGETTLSSAQIKERMKDPALDERSRGFMRFLEENFLDIAGMAAPAGKQNPDKISLKDVVAIGGMNEIAPEKMQEGVKFLQENFFKVSGFDDRVSSERVEKLLFDHSYLLFPKETQEHLFDLTGVIRSSDQRPQNYYHNKRIQSGLAEKDAQSLNPVELSDNLRIQALQKGMFGPQTLKLDAPELSPKALSQYSDAAERYRQLKAKGLDQFLSGLQK